MVGQRISHYLIEAELGRGGMGVVYRATDTKLERTVALKLLGATALSSELDRARFYREAKAAAQLNHPHICHVYEVDEAVPSGSRGGDPRPFIAMEFIEGETLSQLIDRGPIALDEVVRIGCEISSALSAAASKKIVHRDIKSANIMLDKDGAVRVLDFGLAHLGSATKITVDGTMLGTVAYMSPEQARGDEIDHRTDLYALGTVLYEMVAGRVPFMAEYDQAVLYEILNQDPEPLTGIRTGVPVALESIVLKCLAKDPELRYPSAKGLSVDLKRVELASSGSRLRVVSSPQPKGTSSWGRLVQALAILSMGLGAGLFLAKEDAPVATSAEKRVLRAQLSLPDAISPLEAAITPDDRLLYYVVVDSVDGARPGDLRIRDRRFDPSCWYAGCWFPSRFARWQPHRLHQSRNSAMVGHAHLGR